MSLDFLFKQSYLFFGHYELVSIVNIEKLANFLCDILQVRRVCILTDFRDNYILNKLILFLNFIYFIIQSRLKSLALSFLTLNFRCHILNLYLIVTLDLLFIRKILKFIYFRFIPLVIYLSFEVVNRIFKRENLL